MPPFDRGHWQPGHARCPRDGSAAANFARNDGLHRRVALLRQPEPLGPPQDQAETSDDAERCTPPAKIRQQRNRRNREDRSQEARTDDDADRPSALGWREMVGNPRHAIGWDHRRPDTRKETARQ